MAFIMGVDPGIKGGLAILSTEAQLIAVIDVPVCGTAAKERVDVAAIVNFINQHAPAHAFVERAQSMPAQGSSSGFKYGRAVGAIEAAIVCCGIPLTIVEAAGWKKALRLPGKDKEAARQRALQLFPSAHGMLARKMDHGRAEAALIALYGLQLIRIAQ
jgi:crossover junction endodeoxyribonuclease RuvC